jgi:hypothetical protein
MEPAMTDAAASVSINRQLRLFSFIVLLIFLFVIFVKFHPDRWRNLGFPFGFLPMTGMEPFFVILLIFVLLHWFASHFSVRLRFFPGTGGVSTAFLAPMPGFSRM